MPGPEKMKELRHELKRRSTEELADFCLKLARLKTENKEMLTYLLFEAQDDMQYAERVKEDLQDLFNNLSDHYYYSTKNLRRALRLIAKYRRFTRSAQGETELLLFFSEQYLDKADLKTRHLPLQSLQHRALVKAGKLVPSLHEDLQYDYNKILQNLKERTLKEMKHWDKKKLPL